MKKAVAYARYSSEAQTDDSIEAQLREIRKYAESRGYSLEHEYIDRAKSASSADRPAFQQLFKDVKTNKYEAVIIHKIDRFARNIKDAAWYKGELDHYGVELLSVSEDLQGNSGDLVFNIMSSVADWYLKNLKTEIYTKTRVTAEKAFFLGGIPPYGYATQKTYEETFINGIEKKTSRSQYVVNDKESIVIEEMFNLACRGLSCAKIAIELNKLGYRNRQGNEWSYSTIYDMVRNPKYKGTFTWCRGYRRNGRAERDDTIVVENAVPAIVSVDVWEKAQTVSAVRKKEKKHKTVYLCKDLVFCGKCGSKMIPSGGRLASYVCAEWKKAAQYGKATDHFLSVATKKLEDYITNYILYEVLDIADYSALVNGINKYMETTVKDKSFLIEKLKVEKKEYERKNSNLLEAIENGINIEQAKQKFYEYKVAVAEIDKKLENLMNVDKIFNLSIEDIKTMIEEMKRNLQSDDYEQKRIVVESVIKKITVLESHFFKVEINESFEYIKGLNSIV